MNLTGGAFILKDKDTSSVDECKNEVYECIVPIDDEVKCTS